VEDVEEVEKEERFQLFQLKKTVGGLTPFFNK
jgi:hypothetical protein